jgi:hypothetical protein
MGGDIKVHFGKIRWLWKFEVGVGIYQKHLIIVSNCVWIRTNKCVLSLKKYSKRFLYENKLKMWMIVSSTQKNRNNP